MYKLSEHIMYDINQENNKEYLIDIENGDLFELNETAAMLIQYIVEEKSIDEYVNHVLYYIKNESEKEKVKNDIQTYINIIEEQGFIYKYN